jgi:hypothetical protein
MKTLRINLCLLIILTAQIYAQRFTAGMMDSIHTGYSGSDTYYGYFPYNRQTAVLGEKKSSYANIMLIGGPNITLSKAEDNVAYSYNVMNSYGSVFGTIGNYIHNSAEGKNGYIMLRKTA